MWRLRRHFRIQRPIIRPFGAPSSDKEGLRCSGSAASLIASTFYMTPNRRNKKRGKNPVFFIAPKAAP